MDVLRNEVMLKYRNDGFDKMRKVTTESLRKRYLREDRALSRKDILP